MKRSIWFWLTFIISVILATYFAVRITMTLMGIGASAHVRTISVSSDTHSADLNAVYAMAAVPQGTSSYAIDLNTLNARIAAAPGVRTASTRRMPNGNLRVQVKMYRAVAQWTDGENYFPLSADGTIVRRPSDTRDDASVLFRGQIPNDIADITKAAHSLGTELDYLEWIENRRWNLYSRGGVTVLLPEENPTAAIATLVALNSQHRILSRDITVIDMRDDARILVK